MESSYWELQEGNWKAPIFKQDPTMPQTNKIPENSLVSSNYIHGIRLNQATESYITEIKMHPFPNKIQQCPPNKSNTREFTNFIEFQPISMQKTRREEMDLLCHRHWDRGRSWWALQCLYWRIWSWNSSSSLLSLFDVSAA